MYTGKIEPQNDIKLVQNALSDTLELPDIDFIIEEEKVSQDVNKIIIYKKKEKSSSQELF